MTYIRGSGQIIYDPYRGQMKKRNTGWCIITVDTEITRYYRWWLQFEKHIHLQPPSWDAHISIIRGEYIPDATKSVWKQYHKEIAHFEYEHGHIQKFRSGRDDNDMVPGDYYVVNIKCPIINKIRQELGLKVFDDYHLTIGRSYEYEARKPKRFIKERK